MIDQIIKNKEFFGIVVSILAVIVPLATFLIAKGKEQNQLNFEKFHKDLMKGLANLQVNTGLDQQIAIIFEFRNYPKYYPVIRRVLTYQIERWNSELKNSPQFSQLIKEAQYTIKYINSNILSRFLIKLFNKE